MNGANVFRLISLIPERTPRGQSGSRFSADGSARMDLLCRFLHWLGPLNPASREEQHLLGARSGGGRSMIDGEDAGDEATDEPAAGSGEVLAKERIDLRAGESDVL